MSYICCFCVVRIFDSVTRHCLSIDSLQEDHELVVRLVTAALDMYLQVCNGAKPRRGDCAFTIDIPHQTSRNLDISSLLTRLIRKKTLRAHLHFDQTSQMFGHLTLTGRFLSVSQEKKMFADDL